MLDAVCQPQPVQRELRSVLKGPAQRSGSLVTPVQPPTALSCMLFAVHCPACRHGGSTLTRARPPPEAPPAPRRLSVPSSIAPSPSDSLFPPTRTHRHTHTHTHTLSVLWVFWFSRSFLCLLLPVCRCFLVIALDTRWTAVVSSFQVFCLMVVSVETIIVTRGLIGPGCEWDARMRRLMNKTF